MRTPCNDAPVGHPFLVISVLQRKLTIYETSNLSYNYTVKMPVKHDLGAQWTNKM